MLESCGFRIVHSCVVFSGTWFRDRVVAPVPVRVDCLWRYLPLYVVPVTFEQRSAGRIVAARLHPGA